ncbi:SUMO1 sentrin specific peptidase 8 [Tritrichomonas musculus]|uniref:SUMO1 sentrin specific peptidase 8 n=1 Tax=Tritrichomonas musculus TaxID=1915356 RepID=A0ABR2GMS9_9EUKA
MTSSSKPEYVASLGDVIVQQYDINTLSRPYSWVNDAIIHIYGRMLEKNINNMDSGVSKKILFVAPCTVQFIRFFQIDEDVQECLQALNINDFDTVFFPITNGTSFTARGNHWSLLIFLPSLNSFLYCDSVLSHGNMPMACSLIKRIESLLLYKQTELIELNLPSQDNSYDCGVFIMAYMEYYAKHGNFDEIGNHVNQDKMNEFRKEITQQIKNLGVEKS